jgi:hypothetical protein
LLSFFALTVANQRGVGKLGQVETEGLSDYDLFRRIAEVLYTPNDMRDIHLMVIND